MTQQFNHTTPYPLLPYFLLPNIAQGTCVRQQQCANHAPLKTTHNGVNFPLDISVYFFGCKIRWPTISIIAKRKCFRCREKISTTPHRRQTIPPSPFAFSTPSALRFSSPARLRLKPSPIASKSITPGAKKPISGACLQKRRTSRGLVAARTTTGSLSGRRANTPAPAWSRWPRPASSTCSSAKSTNR